MVSPPKQDPVRESEAAITISKSARRERTIMEERETILDILDELAPGAEVEGCTTLVDDRVLDSLTIVALVAELEDAFDITIPAVEVVVENFNSVDGLTAMVKRLVEDQLD